MSQPETQETENPRRRTPSLRVLCVWVFVLLIVASAVAVRAPVMNSSVRAVLAATVLVGLLTAALYTLKLFANRPRALYPGIFLVALFVTWAVLANKPPYMPGLREVYMRRLDAFKGTPFRWGGETTHGIDCSGLARAAFWQAILFEGFRELNPRLLGPNLWRFWWRDLSARDLLIGTYGYTKRVGHAPKLAGYDTYLLEIGDMAVTDDGVHVLIFHGENRWIEADPRDGKVVVNEATADSERGWFNVPVTFVRWWLLEEQE